MQQINLYQLPEKPPVEWLAFEQMLKILGIFIIILFLLSLYDIFKLRYQSKQLKTLQKQKEEYTKLLAGTTTTLAPKPTRVQLEAEQKKLQEQNNQEKIMVERLNTIQKMSNKGFSQYLTALSEQTVTGLWLTDFAFKNLDSGEYIKLKGSALSADLVPKFMDNISHENIFKGSTFQVFILEQNKKNQAFNFVLETVATKETVAAK